MFFIDRISFWGRKMEKLQNKLLNSGKLKVYYFYVIFTGQRLSGAIKKFIKAVIARMEESCTYLVPTNEFKKLTYVYH